MYGAILGDMIGAPYEFDRGDKTKEFPLFVQESQFTDDTVMTIAVAEALVDSEGQTDGRDQRDSFFQILARRFMNSVCSYILPSLTMSSGGGSMTPSSRLSCVLTSQ